MGFGICDICDGTGISVCDYCSGSGNSGRDICPACDGDKTSVCPSCWSDGEYDDGSDADVVEEYTFVRDDEWD